MTQNLGAEATVSNWDGHFTVDNSLCYSPCLQRMPLDMECCSSYAATATRNPTDLANENSTENHDYNSHEGAESMEENGIWSAKSIDSALDYYAAPSRKEIDGPNAGREVSSRLADCSPPTATDSSLVLGDSMSEIVVEDVPNDEPTSALLNYCKHKFLKPYVVILWTVGLSPISTETTCFHACLNYLLDVFLLSLLLLGYFLQYLTSYRGDRGFSNFHKTLQHNDSQSTYLREKSENSSRTIGELLFGFIIPNTLHLLGFASAVFVCRLVDHEQLQNLIERVFLMSMKPRRLCLILWLYLSLGFVFFCVLLSCVTPSVLMQSTIIQLKLIIGKDLNDCQLAIKILLIIAILLEDLVEIIILTSYCIECYLLRVHLSTLSHKLLMHNIVFLDWMREVLEFRKLLDHLNQRVAIPICFYIVLDLSYSFAGTVFLFVDFDFRESRLKVVVLNIANVLLRLVMGLVPFFMAASVTRVCQTAQANGHQIRVRPFVYHNTSSDDLNSTLLFAASLDMSAKLFWMPIQPNYLCFAILVVSIVLLTLGMSLNLSILGTL